MEMRCFPSEGEQPESSCEGDHSPFCTSLRRNMPSLLCTHPIFKDESSLRGFESYTPTFNLQRSNISNLWLAETCSNKSGDVQAKMQGL